MENSLKKTALRMIPYGLYVLTAQAGEDKTAAAAVSWVTQASFEPPLVVVCVRVASFTHQVIQESGAFALNILGKEQGQLASTFFKPVVHEGNQLSGTVYRSGTTGSPILEGCPAYLECTLVGSLLEGDHTVFLGEVVDAGVQTEMVGRPDDHILWVKDLGEKIFYGG